MKKLAMVPMLPGGVREIVEEAAEGVSEELLGLVFKSVDMYNDFYFQKRYVVGGKKLRFSTSGVTDSQEVKGCRMLISIDLTLKLSHLKTEPPSALSACLQATATWKSSLCGCPPSCKG